MYGVVAKTPSVADHGHLFDMMGTFSFVCPAPCSPLPQKKDQGALTRVRLFLSLSLSHSLTHAHTSCSATSPHVCYLPIGPHHHELARLRRGACCGQCGLLGTKSVRNRRQPTCPLLPHRVCAARTSASPHLTWVHCLMLVLGFRMPTCTACGLSFAASGRVWPHQ